MANVTTEQLLQLLIGVARTQQAVIDAVEGQRAGFKMNYFDAALERTAKLRNMQHAATLQDFAARVLMQCQRRTGPDEAQLLKELEAMLSGVPVAAPAPAAAPAVPRPSAAAPAPAAAAPVPRPAPSAPAAVPAPAPAAAVAAAAPPAAKPAAPAAQSDDDLDMTKL
jgi:hypothetical protein